MKKEIKDLHDKQLIKFTKRYEELYNKLSS